MKFALSRLSLSNITDAAASSPALMVNFRLSREISLYKNGIGDVGATYLSEALMVNSTLTKLDSLLEIRSEMPERQDSRHALRVNTSLEALYLENNYHRCVGSVTTE
ncbi:MAG: hypothetical protein OJI67_03590 [Prosthecobacter sp.]|nr:hypothetical protein [Prosthecobacter sp.]